MLTDRNLQLLLRVAERLAQSREEFVFVGGAVVGLLLTDPAAASVRPTEDVDVIVEVAGRTDYQLRLVPELKRLGLQEDMDAKTTCAWLLDGVKVDVMPTDPSILGFTNRWYEPAIAHSVEMNIGDVTARVITAPYFVATKMEAFRSRGASDYYASHDLEDVIAVVDGREELASEVTSGDVELRRYLVHEIAMLLASEDFLNAVPGHSNDRSRTAVILTRLRAIASVAS